MNQKKVLKFVKKGAKIIGFLAPVAGIVYSVIKRVDTSNATDSDAAEYPICEGGCELTDFDGCWWYTCPECGSRIKSNEDGSWTWASEIFQTGTKEITSDFELANISRGGDLTED